MLSNVLALVALIIFGSLNTVAAEPLDAVATTEASASKEEIKATNVIGDDEGIDTGDDDEEKVSGDEHNFNFEEEDKDDEEDFD